MDNVELEVNELMHYGVKGMKWGVITKKIKKAAKKQIRKYKTYRKKKTDEKAVKKELKKENQARKRKSLAEMSDEEIRERIARMELEKKYRDLVAANNPRNDRAKKFVTNVMEKSGEKLAVQVASHYGAKGLNKLIGENVIYANNKKKD